MNGFPRIREINYQQIRPEIRSGDILLCSGNAFFSNLIQNATQSVWSHVGFILRVDQIDRVMVLESVESIGVRAVPLCSYVKDYNGTKKSYPGKIMIARHRDIKQENIVNLSRYATDLLGRPYNSEEIARIAARISMNAVGIQNQTHGIPEHEYICSEYAYVCFKSIGIEIPYNPLGFIAPVDFAKCDEIEPLCYIEMEKQIIQNPHPVPLPQ